MHTQRIKVLDQIKEDIKFDDYTALYELLKYLPHYAISEYLNDEDSRFMKGE